MIKNETSKDRGNKAAMEWNSTRNFRQPRKNTTLFFTVDQTTNALFSFDNWTTCGLFDCTHKKYTRRESLSLSLLHVLYLLFEGLVETN